MAEDTLMNHCLRIVLCVIVALIAVAPVGLRPAGAADSSDGEISESAQPNVTNEICPVMTDERVDPEIFIEFEGQRVYFCCQRCKVKFQRNAEPFRDSLAMVMQASSVDDAGNDKQQSDMQQSDETREPQSAAVSSEQSIASRFIDWLGRLHPAVVHFPIALLIGAAIAELLLMRTGNVTYDGAVRFCIGLGVIGALAAAILGWCYGGFRLVDDNWLMMAHRWVGTSTAIWSLIIAGFIPKSGATARANNRGAFRFVLFLGAIAVGVSGFFGGALVYGLDHYVW